MRPTGSPRRGFTASVAAFGLLAAALIFWRASFVSGTISEFGILAERSYRIARGQTIFRDFDSLSLPLPYYLQGLLLRWNGFRFSALRWYMSIEGAAACVVTVLLLRRRWELGAAPSLVLGSVTLLWSPQLISGATWYDADAYFFILLALASFLRAWEDGAAASYLLFGLSCGLSFFCKQDLGGAALALGAGMAALAPAGGGRRRLVSCAAYAAGAAAAFVSLGALLAYQGALASAFHWAVERALAFRHHHYSLRTMLWYAVLGPRSQVGKLLVLLYAAAFLLPLRLWRRAGAGARDSFLRDAAVGFFLFGLYASSFVTHGAGSFDLTQTGLGCALGLLWRALAWDGPGRLEAGAGGRRLLLLGLAALSLRSLAYVRNHFAPWRGQPYRTVASPFLRGTLFPSTQAERLDRLVRFVEERLTPGESFLAFPPEGFPFAYQAAGRVPPQPVGSATEWIPEYLEADQERVVAALERGGVRWAFVQKDAAGKLQLPAGPLESYLRKRFAAAGELDSGAVVLERRRR